MEPRSLLAVVLLASALRAGAQQPESRSALEQRWIAPSEADSPIHRVDEANYVVLARQGYRVIGLETRGPRRL